MEIAAPPEWIWKVLTGDALVRWAYVFTGMRWGPPPPISVGSIREVTLLGVLTVRERFLRWEETKQFTHTVVEASLPGLRRAAEDWIIEPTPSGSRLTPKHWQSKPAHWPHPSCGQAVRSPASCNAASCASSAPMPQYVAGCLPVRAEDTHLLVVGNAPRGLHDLDAHQRRSRRRPRSARRGERRPGGRHREPDRRNADGEPGKWVLPKPHRTSIRESATTSRSAIALEPCVTGRQCCLIRSSDHHRHRPHALAECRRRSRTCRDQRAPAVLSDMHATAPPRVLRASPPARGCEQLTPSHIRGGGPARSESHRSRSRQTRTVPADGSPARGGVFRTAVAFAYGTSRAGHYSHALQLMVGESGTPLLPDVRQGPAIDTPGRGARWVARCSPVRPGRGPRWSG